MVRSWKATSATHRRMISTRYSTKRGTRFQTKRRPKWPAFLFSAYRPLVVANACPIPRNDGGRCLRSSSCPRRAANVDHVAVAGRRILVDEAGDQNPAVEGDDLAFLLAAGRTRRPNVILAARTAFEAQLLRGCLIGQMHD